MDLVKIVKNEVLVFLGVVIKYLDDLKISIFDLIVQNKDVCKNCSHLHNGNKVNICDKLNINLTKEKSNNFFCRDYENI